MLAKIQTQNQELNRIQDHTIREVNPLFQIPFISGNLLEGIVLGAAAVEVPHLLDRKIKGWIVLDKSANQDVWRDGASKDDTKFINLKAGGTVTVNLWVF